MSTAQTLATIKLSGTKNGEITVANIKDPYGANTGNVASIAISLDGEELDWKVHIPADNIDDVIEALTKVKEAQ